MKVCLACETQHDRADWQCPGCGREPARVGAHRAFAPELAQQSPGFEAHYFSNLAGVEEGSFWFRARNELIVWALRRFFPDARSMLEVGCGTGFVLSAVERAFPQLELRGSEIFCDGLAFAASRTRRAELFQMDARRIPFDAEFDLVAAFDVIEHIEDDAAALAAMYRAVKPGGGLLITVPQHAWLWSQVDEYSRHFRRYDRSGLRARLEAAGFRVKTTTSFVSLLLPPMLASRLAQRLSKRPVDPDREMTLNPTVNTVFERILAVERALIRGGLRLPVGGSLLAVAEKPAAADA